jgi:DNA-binding NtrC family response regulator
LADHFLRIYQEKYRPGTNMRFSPSAFKAMLNSSWKGNVRELQHVIERAVLLSKTDVVEKLDGILEGNRKETSAEVIGSIRSRSEIGAAADMIDLDDICDRVIELISSGELDLSADVIDSLEARIVQSAIRHTSGNKQAAARLLGMYRPRLYGILKRHNISQ